MCLNTHHTHTHTYNYLQHEIRVHHVYIVLTKYDVGEEPNCDTKEWQKWNCRMGMWCRKKREDDPMIYHTTVSGLS